MMRTLRDERGQTILEWTTLAATGFGTGLALWGILAGAVIMLLFSIVYGLVVRADGRRSC
jgi:hypothetical protein